jgi:hypothetical protein
MNRRFSSLPIQNIQACSRGKGSPLVTDKKATIASHPTHDSGTGGFMLILKTNAKTPPDQDTSYFDLDSWVLLIIRFEPD